MCEFESRRRHHLVSLRCIYSISRRSGSNTELFRTRPSMDSCEEEVKSSIRSPRDFTLTSTPFRVSFNCSPTLYRPVMILPGLDEKAFRRINNLPNEVTNSSTMERMSNFQGGSNPNR